MASKICTYKTRPTCAVPSCKNEGFIYLAGQWICGLCVHKWNQNNIAKEKVANEEMFKDIVEVNKCQ